MSMNKHQVGESTHELPAKVEETYRGNILTPEFMAQEVIPCIQALVHDSDIILIQRDSAQVLAA